MILAVPLWVLEAFHWGARLFRMELSGERFGYADVGLREGVGLLGQMRLLEWRFDCIFGP